MTIAMITNTAVTVPVNQAPLIDDTDFKTRKESVAYNAAGMDLVWNFVTSAGVQTQTAVVPTTAGVYDWANKGKGLYNIEIPASGGGSINNNAAGYGWFTGVATGVLPWTGPIITFAAAVGGALTAADVGIIASGTMQAGSTSTTAVLAASTSFANDIINYSTLVIVAGTGVGQARLVDDFVGASDTATISPAWDVTPDATSEYRIFASAPASTVNLPSVNVAKIGGQTATAAGAVAFPGTIASTSNITAVGAVTGAVGSVTGAVGSVAGAVASVTGNVGGNVTGSVGSVTGLTATDVAAIKLIADHLNTALELDGAVYRFTVNSLENAPSGTGASAATIRAEMDANSTKLALIPGTQDGKTFAEIQRLMAAVLLGKASGLNTPTAVFRAIDDSKTRVTASVDAVGNRSAVTLDAS